MQKFEQNNITDKKKAAWLSLIVGLAMFISKSIAYLITNSTAIYSDAAESVVHIAATGFALYSIYLSSKPADETHLFGYGKIEFFSAGLEGLLIIIAAFAIIYNSIKNILTGILPEQLDIGTSIIAAAGIINLLLGFYLIKKGKSTNSLTLIADGKHVLTDSYTSLGVVAGLILVLITNYFILDPLIAITVALNILFTGYKLIRESFGGLMNKTDLEILNTISNLLTQNKREYWIDIHHLRFWKSGEIIFVDFHLILPFYFTIKESHHEEEFVEDLLQSKFPLVSVRIHMDYCKDEVCKFCDFKKCEFRKEEKSINFEWGSKKYLGDPIYMQ